METISNTSKSSNLTKLALWISIICSIVVVIWIWKLPDLVQIFPWPITLWIYIIFCFCFAIIMVPTFIFLNFKVKQHRQSKRTRITNNIIFIVFLSLLGMGALWDSGNSINDLHEGFYHYSGDCDVERKIITNRFGPWAFKYKLIFIGQDIAITRKQYELLKSNVKSNSPTGLWGSRCREKVEIEYLQHTGVLLKINNLQDF